jgi:hypothetical protein
VRNRKKKVIQGNEKSKERRQERKEGGKEARWE